MDIELGKAVVSLDGTRMGMVDRLVIDPESWALDEIIVHHGLWFGEDRIVELFFIDHIDADGTVHLNVVAAEAAQKLPRFIEEAYLIPSPDDRLRMAASISTVGADPSAILWRAASRGAGYERSARPLFETASTTKPQVEVHSNLLNEDVTIDRGTQVVGSDGRRLGVVADVVYADGHIDGIVVDASRMRHDAMTVPTAWVESVTHKRVRLNLPAVDALKMAPREQPHLQEGSDDVR